MWIPWGRNHLFMRCQSHGVKAGTLLCCISKKLVCVLPLTCCCYAPDPPTAQSGTGQNWCPAGEVIPQHSLRDLCLGIVRRVSKQTPERSRSHTYVVDKQMCCFLVTPDLQQADRRKSPCRSVPLPPAGELRVRDVTHSAMNLDWDAAPGPVEKYLITYKPDTGDAKEVSSCWSLPRPCGCYPTRSWRTVWTIRVDEWWISMHILDWSLHTLASRQ